MGSSASDPDRHPVGPAGDDHGAARREPSAGRGLLRWFEQRDPGLRATKRSIRAAIFVPSVFAIAVYGVGNSQTPLFAVFGAVALLVFVDFGGPFRVRVHSYLGLWVVGAVLIVVGTLCSKNAAAAIVAMAVVGFVVLSAGLVLPQAVTGSTAALLTFVLPVAVPGPASSIGERLLGWALAGAICIPAALLLWSGRWHDRLRLTMAAAARSVADLLREVPSGAVPVGTIDVVHRALAAMRAQFDTTPYRPTGAGPTDVALSNMVARLEWVGSRAIAAAGCTESTAGIPSLAVLDEAAAAVLCTIADLLGEDDPASHRDTLAVLVREMDALEAARSEVTEEAMATFLNGAEVPDAHRPESAVTVLAEVDPSYPTRMLAFATEMVAELTLQALSPRPHGPGRWRRRRDAARSYVRFVAGHATVDSVWMRNSVRGAVALSLAVAVVEFTTVQHGFWVVLGTLSVLRSSALGTGSTAVRAVAGTAAGVIIGALVLEALGRHDSLLWAVLPVAVLVATAAPSVSSFAAGQAGFTVVVVVIFNIIEPVGPTVGLVRVEDVAIGAGVSVVVGLLFWPRGASSQLARAMGQAYAAATAWLISSADRVGRGDPVGVSSTESPERTGAIDTARRLDDAYRQFLSERGAKRVPMPVVTRLVTGCAQIRLTAVTLESLPQLAEPGGPAPLPVVVAARRKITEHLTAMERWFDEFARSLARRDVTVPPLPAVDRELPSELADAWMDVRRAGRRDGLFAMLRLLWVEQRIDDLRRLQVDLAGVGDRLQG